MHLLLKYLKSDNEATRAQPATICGLSELPSFSSTLLLFVLVVVSVMRCKVWCEVVVPTYPNDCRCGY